MQPADQIRGRILSNNCRNDKTTGSEEDSPVSQCYDTSLHYTLQLSSRVQQCCSPSFLSHLLRSNGWWFIRPLHIDLRSSALLRTVWRYQHFFLLALLGVSFSDGAKQHSVISNKNMPICITCGFYSCVSYKQSQYLSVTSLRGAIQTAYLSSFYISYLHFKLEWNITGCQQSNQLL